MNAIAKKAEAKEPEREVPAISPKTFKWQSEGFAWREAFVRLPDGMILQDLNDHPTAWRKVQSEHWCAFRQWDQVRAVSWDEDWFIDATVSFADMTQVILAGIKKTEMPKRSVTLYEDATYRVEWCGSGYGVVRKSDGVLMGASTYQTVEGARQYLLSLYPQQVHA